MAQRIKPDRPIWPSAPDIGRPGPEITTCAAGPALPAARAIDPAGARVAPASGKVLTR